MPSQTPFLWRLSSAYIRLSPVLWELGFFAMLFYTAALVAPAQLDGWSVMMIMLSMVITARLVVIITGWAMGAAIRSLSNRVAP